jgi:MSHA pilin protein MshD
MCIRCADRARESGFSLLEVVMAILILGGALVGILSVTTFTMQHSADPMVQTQASMIAESYMEEILPGKFVDPTSNTVCPPPPANRSGYDNICDYNGLSDTGARDQLGNPIAELANYNIAVTVTGDSTVTLNNINNVGAVRLLRVDVVVTGPLDITVSLSAYRTNYNCYNPGGDKDDDKNDDDGCRPL